MSHMLTNPTFVSAVFSHEPACSLTSSLSHGLLVFSPDLSCPHLLHFQGVQSWGLAPCLSTPVVQARRLGVSHVSSLVLISHSQSTTRLGELTHVFPSAVLTFSRLPRLISFASKTSLQFSLSSVAVYTPGPR